MTLYSFCAWLFITPLFQCFDVNESLTAAPDNIEVADIIDATIRLSPNRIWFNDQTADIASQEIILFEHKDQLLLYLNCTYTFPSCSSIITADVRSVELLDGHPLGNYIDIIDITDQGHTKHYLHAKNHLFTLAACDSMDRCFAPTVLPNEIDTFLQSNVREEILDSVSFTPSIFETITERILLKEASSRLVVRPAEFEDISELRLAEEMNVCSGVTAIIDTITEYILVREASNRITTHPAEYETVTERVLDKEAHRKIDTISRDYQIAEKLIELCPAIQEWQKISIDSNCLFDNIWPCIVYRWDSIPTADTTYQYAFSSDTCPFDYFIIENYCVTMNDVNAAYGERSYERLFKPASTETIEIPAEYSTNTYLKIVNTNEVPDSCIIKIYDTVSYEKLVIPTSVSTIEIPAEYGERTYQRLHTPARIDRPHQSRNEFSYIKKHVKQHSRIISNYEIVCEHVLTPSIIAELATKLKNLGHDLGSDTEIHQPKFACAIIAYQQANGIPIGSLNFETLNALDIQY